MAAASPPIHRWRAGDPMNAARMNEIGNSINWLRNPPKIRVGRTLTAQNAATGSVYTMASFDTVYNSYDPYDMWDISDPTKVYARVAGWYTYEAVMNVTSNSDNSRTTMSVFLNGGTPNELIMRWDQQTIPAASGGNINMRKEAQMFMNVNDYLQVGFWYNGATARQMLVASANECPQLRLRWISN